jgi:hypothetical protein
MGCKLASDCYLFSYYCQDAPCTCKALANGTPPPMCMGPMVQCLKDPCQGQQAGCLKGMCVLVAVN